MEHFITFSTVFLLIFGLQYEAAGSPNKATVTNGGIDYNERCTLKDKCKYTNTSCIDGICQCQPGHAIRLRGKQFLCAEIIQIHNIVTIEVIDVNKSCRNSSCYSGFLVDLIRKIDQDMRNMNNCTITEVSSIGSLDSSTNPPTTYKLAKQRYLEQLLEKWFVNGTSSWSKKKQLTPYEPNRSAANNICINYTAYISNWTDMENHRQIITLAMNQTILVDDDAVEQEKESTNLTTVILDDDTAEDKDGIVVGENGMGTPHEEDVDFGESGVADVNISWTVSPPLEISNSHLKETNDEVSNLSIVLAVVLVMATQDYLLKGLNNHCEDNNQIRHNNRFSPLCTVENYLQNNLNYVSQRLNDYQQGLTNTPLSLSKSRSLEIQSLLNRYSSSRNRPEPTPSSSPSPASSEEHISTTAVSSVQLHAPNPASQFEDARQHFRSRRLQPSVRPILPRAFPTVIIHPGNHPTSLPPSFLNASIATTTVPLDSFEQTFQEYNKLWGRNPRKYIHFTPSRQMCKNL
ncbi:hypothetical protein Fcan01_11483 [Folsomia candida]|uniref:EB domain-containing protein n=1 Tax=Folsomia candida TaxID=158441 RepID=A0A226EBL1_FOLCA|nr:hypothetical protein Fcan01_11483 [Folsomia candida]